MNICYIKYVTQQVKVFELEYLFQQTARADKTHTLTDGALVKDISYEFDFSSRQIEHFRNSSADKQR